MALLHPRTPRWMPVRGDPAAHLGFTNGVRAVTFYAEAVRLSGETADLRILFEVAPDDRATVTAEGAVRITAVRLGLTPDFDRDGKIDDVDKALLLAKGQFRIWINDDADDDDDETGSGDTDRPGQSGGWFGSANYDDNQVNGLCDLLDFFPIWLDLHEALNALPPGGSVQYKLRHADNALKAVYTDLTKGVAGNHLTVSNNVYGPTFSQAAHEAVTFEITSSGVALATNFLNKIKSDACKGVLILEGTADTEAPLLLEVWKDGSKIMERTMPLHVSGVEDMYRWINLRPDAPSYYPSRTNEPPNRPDADCLDETVFLAHGYLVTREDARSWASECFKRLYQCGMNARFCGMSWRADEGSAADYYLNVQNARQAAALLAPIINAMPADKVFLAHSLGNMLASYAIADFGMDVDKYFALNAAVAAEAFDASTTDDSDGQVNYMRHDNWVGFSNRTWTACWHRLFQPADDRSRLTWRNRFTNVLDRTEFYNFWSSGDEVLEIATDGTPTILEMAWMIINPWSDGDTSQYIWHKQEFYKGRNIIYGTGWAGWGFESNVTAAAANAASNAVLRDAPIFEHDPESMFAASISTNDTNNILIKGIPALCWPLGRRLITINGVSDRNIDMNNSALTWRPNGWLSHDKYGDRWLHSELIYVAHYYSYKLYETFIATGGLN